MGPLFWWLSSHEFYQNLNFFQEKPILFIELIWNTFKLVENYQIFRIVALVVSIYLILSVFFHFHWRIGIFSPKIWTFVWKVCLVYIKFVHKIVCVIVLCRNLDLQSLVVICQKISIPLIQNFKFFIQECGKTRFFVWEVCLFFDISQPNFEDLNFYTKNNTHKFLYKFTKN